MGCAPVYIAASLLTVAAAAIGNTRRIKLKSGWCEPLVLWFVLLGESGDKKTHGLKKALFIPQIFEMENNRAHREAMQLYKIEKKQAQENGDDPPPKPKPVRYMVMDITTEKLAEILEDNARGVLLGIQELSGWFRSFNQYKGKGSDVSRWLECYDAGPWNIDRKNLDDPIYVPHAAVSIIGTIQPSTFQDATVDHVEDGMLSRMLVALPPSTRSYWTNAIVQPDIENKVVDVFRKLYQLRFPKGSYCKAIDLPLSKEAQDIFIEFHDRMVDERAALSGYLKSVWSKLVAQAARLALTIHLIRKAAKTPKPRGKNKSLKVEPIGAESMEAGIKIARWFGQEARRVFVILQEDSDERDTRRFIEQIKSMGGSVTVREWQRTRSKNSTEDARDELQMLVEAGHGKLKKTDSGSRGGRPSERFILTDKTDDNDETSTGLDSVSSVMSVSSSGGISADNPKHLTAKKKKKGPQRGK